MNVTNLALKHVYYEQIRKGLKTTEYREITPYYIEKFLDKTKYKGMSDDEIKTAIVDGTKPVYKNGITHLMFFENGRKMLVEVKEIKVYKEHPMFAIKLGKHQQIQ